MQVRATLSRRSGPVDEPVARCIEACLESAQACISCADSCLAEAATARLDRCIRLSLDCAEACAATGQMLTRRALPNATLRRRMVETCADLCRACAEECDRHGVEHAHCRVCAEACLACERACRAVALSP